MVYTGTLPPKLPREADAPTLPGAVARPTAEAKDADERGKTPYYFVLIFTFFLLARPQDFIKPLRGIQFAMLFGSIAIFTWALSVISGQLKFRKSREMSLMLSLTIWFFLGVPFSIFKSNALNTLGTEWIKIVMIFIVLTQTITSTKRLRQLLWVMFVSGLLATASSLVLGNYDFDPNAEQRYLGMSRGFFFGNYLGIAAAVIVPYLAAMFVHTRSFLKQLFMVACFSTMVFSLVLTASRSNLICIIISLILVWAMVLKDTIKSHLIGIFFALGLVLSIVFAPLAFWERVGTLWGSEVSAQSTAGDEAEESARTRRMILDASIQATFTKPIFGVGAGNFVTYSGDVIRIAKGTHNTFTQVSSEGGIPALIMFVMLLITGITRMRRMVRLCKGKPELAQEKSFASATIVSIVSFMVGGFFAHLAWEYYVYYLFLISVSLQTIYTLKTGESLVFPKANSGMARGNGGDGRKRIAWGRLSRVGHEGRA
jgi:O-antigen ligase